MTITLSFANKVCAWIAINSGRMRISQAGGRQPLSLGQKIYYLARFLPKTIRFVKNKVNVFRTALTASCDFYSKEKKPCNCVKIIRPAHKLFPCFHLPFKACTFGSSLVLHLLDTLDVLISNVRFQEDTYNGDDMNDMSTDFTSRGMTNPEGNYGTRPSLTYGASPNYHPSYDGYASKYPAQLPPELRRVCE